MKRFIFLIVTLFITLNSYSENRDKKVQVVFSHAVFQMSGSKPYVETYLMVNGASVVFRKTATGKFQGQIEVILTVSQGDKITYADKYNLLSPETDDSLKISFNFIDQQRIPIIAGNYELGVLIRDLN